MARAIAALRPSASETLQPATTSLPVTAAPTVGPATTPTVAADSRQNDPPPDPPSQTDRTDTTDRTPMDEVSRRVPFQRGLGSYSLRSSQPAALFVTRRHRCFDVFSDGIRGHRCALAASSVSSDPRTRKQAMADDAAG
eukprot:3380192-Pleurochrysis_carterae.AAC.1